MKTRFINLALLGLSLIALPLLGGCTHQATATSDSLPSSTNAEPVVADPSPENPATTAAAEPGPEAIAPVATVVATPATNEVKATVPDAAPKLPPNLSVSAPLAQVISLTQSGVDQTLLLSFITNTTGMFGLGADEIVYLNDLGVPGDVITTMMQHDQELRVLRLSAVQANAPAATVVSAPPAPVEEEVASAPTYVTAPEMEAEPAYVSDDYFVETLAPYGTWIVVPGYGNCWRPTVVVGNPGWRPYCNRGQWVYSNCGWYWLSDYSWGATTFHYGRWFNAPSVGWCWWPDSVWAPSWVSWRYTSEYCGWAPLPPMTSYRFGYGMMYQNGDVAAGFGFGLGASAYAFVPWGTFCAPRPYQHCLPPNRAAQVYATATPVNHYEAGGRGQVYNRGIAPERVREYSRAEVRTVTIRDQVGPARRAEQIDRDGTTLAVHRPILVPAGGAEGNDLQPVGKSAARTELRRGNEAVNLKSTLQSTPATPSLVGRTELKTGRERQEVIQNVESVPSPLLPPSARSVEAKPSLVTAGRVESRPGRVAEAVNQIRPGSPAVVRPSDISVAPVTAVAVTPRAPQPRIGQVTPQNATRPSAPVPSSSVVVIGGRNTRPSQGRDYSVYSSPSPTPVSSAPARTPANNYTPRPTSSPNVSAPQIAEDSPPTVSRAQPERSLPSRTETGRSQTRSSYPTYPAPSQSVQVTTVGVRPSPSVSSTPRSVPTSPAPNYTSRPTPSAAPSATRAAPAAPPVSAPVPVSGSPARPSR